jgi:hypothetical protein
MQDEGTLHTFGFIAAEGAIRTHTNWTIMAFATQQTMF